jgi:ubiquinone/menaquinone biosynthesis C-methylase UbiE
MDTTIKSYYMPALPFEGLTPYYDVVVGMTTREHRFKQALIDLADIRPGHQVLDFASGTGSLAVWLKTLHPKATITGVDGSSKMIEIAMDKAAKAGTDVHFDQADADELPYMYDYFDRVLSTLSFHHLTWEFKQRAAAELFRVMKPGAELYVADWGMPTNRLMRSLFLPLQLLDGFANTQDNITGKIIPLFKDTGFEQVTVQQTLNTIHGTMALYRAVKPLDAPSTMRC